MSFIVTQETTEKMKAIATRGNPEEPIAFLDRENFLSAFQVTQNGGDAYDLINQIQNEIDKFDSHILLGYESYKDLFHWHYLRDDDDMFVQKQIGEVTALHYHITNKKPSKTGRMMRLEERKRVTIPKANKKWKVYA